MPYCAAFTIFSNYMRSAIRLTALAQCGTIFATTHDSIAVGEDGPTHQPIETVPSPRVIAGWRLPRRRAIWARRVSVVPMPSWELFRAQPDSYKESVLSAGVPKLGVEAVCTTG